MLVYPMLPVMQTSSRRCKSTEETGTEIQTLQKYRGNGNGKVDKLPVLLPFLQI